MNLIPGFGQFLQWITYLVNAGVFYVLFRLSSACIRYRKSAVLKCIHLGTLILAQLMPALGLLISLLVLAGSVCGIIASYQELYGHSEVVKDADENLSGKWRNLFIWQIVVGVLVGLSTSAAVLISALSGGQIPQELVVAILSVPSILLLAVYLVYLKRTLKVL